MDRRFSCLFGLTVLLGCASTHTFVPGDPPGTSSSSNCDLADGPRVRAFLTLIGNELVLVRADGSSTTALYEFNGVGTEASILGPIHAVPNLVRVAGEYALVSVHWYPDVPFRGSQEVVLLHRDRGLLWRRVQEGDDTGTILFVDSDGFVSMGRSAQGRQTAGFLVRPDGSTEELPGEVYFEHFPVQNLLLRQCPMVGPCAIFWWREGEMRSIDAPPGRWPRRAGDDLVHMDADGTLHRERPFGEAQASRVALEAGSARLMDTSDSGWLLISNERRESPNLLEHFRVRVDTGEVIALPPTTGETVQLRMAESGEIFGLFRRNEGVTAMALLNEGDWQTVGDPLPPDYEVWRLAPIRGSAFLLEFHASFSGFNDDLELIDGLSGSRYLMMDDHDGVAADKISVDGRCFANWRGDRGPDGLRGPSQLEVLSLATGSTRELASSSAAPIHWAEGW